MSVIRMVKTAEPPVPPTSRVYIYVDQVDGHLKQKNDDGTVYDLTVGGGGGGATTFTGLTDTPNSYSGQAGKVVAVKGDETGLEFIDVVVTDEKVKVSSTDTTSDYLVNKIVAGENVTITVLNSGSNERLEISATGSGGGSTTPGGSNGQIQYNDNGTFGGATDLIYDKNTGRFRMNTDVYVKRLWFYDNQDPSAGAHAYIGERPSSSYRRIMFFGEPDSASNTFGFIVSPIKGDETAQAFFGFWNTNFDDGGGSLPNSAYGGVVLDANGRLGFRNSKTVIFFAPSNTDSVFFVRVGSKTHVGINNSDPPDALSVGTAGDGTRAIANEWAVYSDARIKDILGDFKPGLDEVLKLQPKAFKYKDSGKEGYGLIAQDVLDVIPEAVGESGKYYSINYNVIISALINAIKKQQEIINDLSSRISKLEEAVGGAK